MAKKKHSEPSTSENAHELPAATSEVETPEEVAVASSAPLEAPTLTQQVQSFLSQRSDLAAKLAAEIKATEEKLVELRKTAAMLFPENTTSATKEKKPKKPAKPKVLSRDDEPVSPASEPEAA